MSTEILAAITTAQNNLRRCQLRIHTAEELDNGPRKDRTLKLGQEFCYDPATIVGAIDAKGGDVWAWMRSQIEDRYPAKSHPNLVVVGVDLDVF